jgi:hypothetical protein
MLLAARRIGSTAVQELLREAQEYGADAIIGLEFHIDDVKRLDIEAPRCGGRGARGWLSSSRRRGDRPA